MDWPQVSQVVGQYRPTRIHAAGRGSLLRYHEFLHQWREPNKTYMFLSSDTYDHCPTANWWGEYYLHRRSISGTAQPKLLLDPPRNGVVQVAVHLRRFDITTIASRSKRVHHDHFFVNAIQEIRDLVPSPWRVSVNVMTSTLFAHQAATLRRSASTMYPNATLHLNDKETDTFHAFVTADILVLDWSRFSHLAGLWSRGIKIASEFRYATDCDALWVAATENGHVDKEGFRTAWQEWTSKTPE
mmetsp:Transcript_65820/g.110477  ORF Transcript_65820/g.110477 Transcript_65820/m.110477 type:complete len:243 (+) Transcript_65820:1-729(+)